jgi:hypothetical protein
MTKRPENRRKQLRMPESPFYECARISYSTYVVYIYHTWYSTYTVCSPLGTARARTGYRFSPTGSVVGGREFCTLLMRAMRGLPLISRNLVKLSSPPKSMIQIRPTCYLYSHLCKGPAQSHICYQVYKSTLKTARWSGRCCSLQISGHGRQPL